ncbi:membrane-spanning 4-domains subfamily A member 12-like [Watersipora subatra]|uniref:membrane-spanning 4-domains subfamily A member 12-like n=1 Tax=Watersipora subatra TaxID=2589382 RepID=UPI00355C1446
MEYQPQMQQSQQPTQHLPQQPLQQPLQQPPQQQYAAQPGVTVVTQNPQGQGYKLKETALTQMKGLSVTQVVMGVLCILFGIALIPVELGTSTGLFSITSYGIWSGVYFVIVGGIGLGAVKRNTGGWITATMVLNIISSALFFLPLISMASTGLAINASYSCGSYYYYGSCPALKAAISLNVILLLISIAELVITIWSATLCCGAVCSCCLPTRPNPHIQYAAPALQTQQQYVACPGTVPAYQVNLDGSQFNAAGPVPTTVTQGHQQQSIGYQVQPQQPPAYRNLEETTPHPNFQPATYLSNPK